eukprot:6466044-Amphidinium_carterae.1
MLKTHENNPQKCKALNLRTDRFLKKIPLVAVLFFFPKFSNEKSKATAEVLPGAEKSLGWSGVCLLLGNSGATKTGTQGHTLACLCWEP